MKSSGFKDISNSFDYKKLSESLNFKYGISSPFIIAGPCVIEDFKTLDSIAVSLKEYSERLNFNLIFKASYDKANRTSFDSFRGPGIDRGLEMLSEIKAKYNVPVLSDIHLPEEAQKAAEVLDIIQIPAFLSRQTDLLVAAAETGKVVNVKKGQFLAPWDARHVVDKIRKSGNNKVILTERGVSFGYNNLVVDFRSLPIMKELGVPVIFDATHSVQMPGGGGPVSSGDRKFVMPLARAAAAVGVDGIFFEVHPFPDKALSDSANSVYLDTFGKELEIIMGIAGFVGRDTDN